MSDKCDNPTKAQLAAQVRALQRQLHERGAGHDRHLIEELQVHQEELQSQTDELLAARKAMEESRDAYIALYDFAPLAYVTLDGYGVIRHVNLTGIVMLGAGDRAKVLGYPLLGRVRVEDRGAVLDHMRRCRQQRGVVQTELRLQAQDGRAIPVLLTSRTMEDRHEPQERSKAAFLTAITDLGPLKQAEASLRTAYVDLEGRTVQLRRLTAELMQVEQRERRRLAQLLHDGLQQVLVAARLRLHRAALPGPRPERQADITDAAAMISEAIDASRALTLELSPPILYDGSLEDALHWLGRWMDDKHQLAVDVRVDPGTELEALPARLLLFMAVRELLFNVVKHAGVRQARVVVGREDGQWVRALVEDRGQGYDPAAGRAKGAASESFGLFSLEQRLAETGGWMEIRSAPGAGTRVTIRVPIRPAPPETPEAPEAPEAPGSTKLPAAAATAKPAPRGPAGVKEGVALPAAAGNPEDATAVLAAGIRVLLVDDHKILRDGLATLLRDQPGIAVVGEAANGEEAVDLARCLHPDVVLMDVSMPRLGGVEATRRIRQEWPGVAVIGLSMHDQRDMQAAMREAGATAYFTKDGAADDLVAAIRQVRGAAGAARSA